MESKNLSCVKICNSSNKIGKMTISINVTLIRKRGELFTFTFLFRLFFLLCSISHLMFSAIFPKKQLIGDDDIVILSSFKFFSVYSCFLFLLGLLTRFCVKLLFFCQFSFETLFGENSVQFRTPFDVLCSYTWEYFIPHLCKSVLFFSYWNSR